MKLRLLTSASLVAAMTLVPSPADAKAKKKQAAPTLSPIEIVEKVNNHWQETN